MTRLDQVKHSILELRKELPAERSLLVGISGIDASGKGYITGKLAEHLANEVKVAVINVDGWLNLPHVRFSDTVPGEYFYHHALRLDEMFDGLVLPLIKDRSVKVTSDFAEETAVEFRQHEYVYKDIDVILLEGIFLFKHAFVERFDMRIWIECSFETALQRALARSQEGLSQEQTLAAYEQIYFPAQRFHFERDHPMKSANIIFDND